MSSDIVEELPAHMALGPNGEQAAAVAALRGAMFAALGWSTARYNEDRPSGPVTGYRTYDDMPVGIQHGDEDHPDWTVAASRAGAFLDANPTAKAALAAWLRPTGIDHAAERDEDQRIVDAALSTEGVTPEGER